MVLEIKRVRVTGNTLSLNTLSLNTLRGNLRPE